MHERPRMVLVAAALLAASAGCRKELSREDHRQDLIDTREVWVEAIREGDVERIFTFWTDDVVIYPVSEPAVVGIDAVREYVVRNRQELGLAPRMTPLEIVASESGDLAYVLGTHEWIDRDGRATLPGRYVSLWRRNDQGEWKCFLEIHSPRPPEDVQQRGASDEDVSDAASRRR